MAEYYILHTHTHTPRFLNSSIDEHLDVSTKLIVRNYYTQQRHNAYALSAHGILTNTVHWLGQKTRVYTFQSSNTI